MTRAKASESTRGAPGARDEHNAINDHAAKHPEPRQTDNATSPTAMHPDDFLPDAGGLRTPENVAFDQLR